MCVTHSANLNLPREGPAETSEWERVNQIEHPLGIWLFVYVILVNPDKYLEIGVSVIYCCIITSPHRRPASPNVLA